jgi:hypothetical protein
MQEEYGNIREAVNKLLNIKSTVKRKKQTKQTQDRDMFINIINTLEMLQTRSNLLFSDLRLDYSTYDEPYYEIIESLLFMKFGKDAYEVISFYLWERFNPDGSSNELLDENNNPVPLETAQDLWNVIMQLGSKKQS